VRPATLEDLPQVVALFDASDAAYGLAPGMDLDLFRTLFLGRGFDPKRNSFLITAPGGELVGYGDVKEELEEDAVTHFGKVHPEHRSRGLGGWLVDALEHRAVEIAAGRPLMLRATALWLDIGGIHLYEMLGYRHVRDFMHMERSLEDLAPLALPSGVTIRPFREGDGPPFTASKPRHFGGSGASRRCRSRSGRSGSREKPSAPRCGSLRNAMAATPASSSAAAGPRRRGSRPWLSSRSSAAVGSAPHCFGIPSMCSKSTATAGSP
jgi:GNAT superfamily N-acetyltransferase